MTISGNLTRDADLRITATGVSILSFGMAVNDRRKNQQTGEWEDYPNFVDCALIGNRAESLSKILHKGMMVVVDGKLHYSSWEKDGQKRSKIEVTVNEIVLPPRGQQGQRQAQAQQGYFQGVQPIQQQQAMPQQYQQQYQQPVQQPAQQPVQQPQQDFYSDDIPF